MNTVIHIKDRPVIVSLSDAAEQAIGERTSPLMAEMELYFSCLLRKRVNFKSARGHGGTVRASLNDQVDVSFRPIMTKHCTIAEVVDEPDTEDFPIQRTASFIPRWLEMDHKDGIWSGDFGY